VHFWTADKKENGDVLSAKNKWGWGGTRIQRLDEKERGRSMGSEEKGIGLGSVPRIGKTNNQRSPTGGRPPETRTLRLIRGNTTTTERRKGRILECGEWGEGGGDRLFNRGKRGKKKRPPYPLSIKSMTAAKGTWEFQRWGKKIGSE